MTETPSLRMPAFEHLHEVGMTYGEHARFSLSLAWQFAVASVKAIVHALYPDVWITSSTDTLEDMQRRIHARVHAQHATT